jgi:hypothetical protein
MQHFLARVIHWRLWHDAEYVLLCCIRVNCNSSHPIRHTLQHVHISLDPDLYIYFQEQNVFLTLKKATTTMHKQPGKNLSQAMRNQGLSNSARRLLDQPLQLPTGYFLGWS